MKACRKIISDYSFDSIWEARLFQKQSYKISYKHLAHHTTHFQHAKNIYT